jgi:hypothetical protein
VRVQLIGLDRLANKMKRAGAPPTYLAQAVFAEATTVLNEAKKITPIDFGALRSSGKVEPPKITPREVSVEVTFGGAAAPYALYVHEDTRPKNWSVPGTGPKFLEIPAEQHAPKFAEAVKRRMDEHLRGTDA